MWSYNHPKLYVEPPLGVGMGGHSSSAVVRFDDQIDGISEVDPLVEGSPLSFSVFKFSEMLRQHHMLGPNKFSLLFNMSFDTNEIAVPRLIWDDSFSLNKGDEAFYSLDVAPLALWDPNGGLNLVTEEGEIDGFFSEDELEPSEWVRTMIKGFGTFMGFPSACYERQRIAFFEQFESLGKTNYYCWHSSSR